MSTHDSRTHNRRGRAVLVALILLGCVLLAYYASWWRSGGRIVRWELALLLAVAAAYALSQLVGSWVVYLYAERRAADPPPVDPDLTVDVLVTACREPPELVRRSLAAAVRMRGEHVTWLADDGDDPRLRAVARELDARYLTREGNRHRKAGNVNAALQRLQGDVVVIFDVDHVPEPEFLERTLGHFRDPGLGFVQVMLSFSNGNASWIARASSESCSDYYNPTCMGADRMGGASLVGTNALIRRSALDSIGGYRPGLAEDLATSIQLHAGGWRSVYVAEPLAPGLAPEDLSAWFVQQLKWSRGVFDLLLTAYPRRFVDLTWGQRIAYLVRMTYYWVGVVVVIHLGFLIALLLGGSRVAQIDFQDYLVHATPLIVCSLTIRQTAMWFFRHPSTRMRLLWRAMFLVTATWPLYALAWVLALVRIPVRFHPTPKSQAEGVPFLWILPQIAATGALVLSLLYATLGSDEECPPALVLFAFVHLFAMGTVLWQAFLPEPEPVWTEPHRRAGVDGGTGIGTSSEHDHDLIRPKPLSSSRLSRPPSGRM